MADFVPFTEKYRPTSVKAIKAHQEIVETLHRLVSSSCLPHLLFHGPAGTGKTTTALAIAKTIYGDELWRAQVLELNASDERGIDVVRDRIKTFAQTRSLFRSTGSDSQPKMIILDESDNMTKAAQFALRRMIEKYSGNVTFVLICNYASKIIPALKSRCTQFRFPKLPRDEIETTIREICVAEGITITPDGIRALAVSAQGDMRKVLNLLQSLRLSCSSTVDDTTVYRSLGYPSSEQCSAVFNNLFSKSFKENYAALSEFLLTQNVTLVTLMGQLHKHMIELNLPLHARRALSTGMADIEIRLQQGCDGKLQLGCLLATIFNARAIVAAAGA